MRRMEELLASPAGSGAHLSAQVLGGLLLLGGLAAALALAVRHRRHPPDKQALDAALAARAWTTAEVGAILAAWCLLYVGALFSGRLFYEEHVPLARLAVTVLVYGIVAAVAAAINHLRVRRRAAGCGMGRKALGALRLAPVFYLAVLPFLMVAAKAYHLLLEHGFGVEPELQEVARIVMRPTTWIEALYMLVAIFVAPVYEELLFRGILFPYLAKRAGLGGGMALVSLLFALLHFHLPSLVPLYLLSAALCLAYWRTGSLWTGIGMHALFNAVTILALNLAG